MSTLASLRPILSISSTGGFFKCFLLGNGGGGAARFFGDGMLVYFGYPRAHEDETQRAIHAGLEILDGLDSLDGVDDVDYVDYVD